MADFGPGTGAVGRSADDERYDDDALAEALSAQLHSSAVTNAIAVPRPGLEVDPVSEPVRSGAVAQAVTQYSTPPAAEKEAVASKDPRPAATTPDVPPDGSPGRNGPATSGTGTATRAAGSAWSAVARPTDTAVARRSATQDEPEPAVDAGGPRHAAARTLRGFARPGGAPDRAADRAADRPAEPTTEPSVDVRPELFEPMADRGVARSAGSGGPASGPASTGPASGEPGVAEEDEIRVADDADPHRIDDLFEPRRIPAPAVRPALPRSRTTSPVTATLPPPLSPWALSDDQASRPAELRSGAPPGEVDDTAAPVAPVAPVRAAVSRAEATETAQVDAPGGEVDGSNGRGSRLASGGFWIPFVVLGGAVASPFAIALGARLQSGAPASLAALLIGVAVVLPAVLRAARVGASGGTTLDVSELALSARAGSSAAGVLMIVRVAAAAIALTAVGRVATIFTARTGLFAGSDTAALGGVVLVGLAAVLVAAASGRAATVVAAAAGALGLLLAIGLLLVLPGAPAATAPAAATSAAGSVSVGASVGVLIGLLLAVTVADLLPRRPRSFAGARRGPAAAAVVAAAAVGVLVPSVAAIVGPAAGGSDEDPLGAVVDALVDATPAALAVPVLAALLVGAVPLPAALIRSAGATAAELAGAGRSRGLGSVAAGLVAVALALGALALGLPVGVLVGPIGLVLAVPVAAWAGVLTVAPARSARGRRAVLPALAAVLVATVLGWVFVDGFAGGVAPLAVALVFGLLGGLLARSRRGVPAGPAGNEEAVGRDG